MRTVFEALLFIRSPHLDQLTLEHLQTVISRKPARIGTYSIVAFSRVLASMGTVPKALEIHRPIPDRKSSPALTRGVPLSGHAFASSGLNDPPPRSAPEAKAIISFST